MANKNMFLICFLIIGISACETPGVQNVSSTDVDTVSLINADNDKEDLEEIEQDMYLITSSSVGFFKLGSSWRNAANKYKYESIQGYGTCVDACCDGGFQLGEKLVVNEYGWAENPDIIIGALRFEDNKNRSKHEANKEIFYVVSDNCPDWFWMDSINNVTVYSESFKTAEGVGVGTTLEEVKQINGVVNISIGWLEEDNNAIKLFLPKYPNLDFILDLEDAKGGYEKLSTIGEKAEIKDFKENTKIKRIIVRS
jgi:NAD-dependent dihydropyrimidine dehydrogenase PreA subunit